jgi:hypothetical protein
VFETDTALFACRAVFGEPIVQYCLRDLNHDFDRWPGGGDELDDAIQTRTVSASTAISAATSGVARPGSASASGFREVRWGLLALSCPKRGDLNVPQHDALQ